MKEVLKHISLLLVIIIMSVCFASCSGKADETTNIAETDTKSADDTSNIVTTPPAETDAAVNGGEEDAEAEKYFDFTLLDNDTYEINAKYANYSPAAEMVIPSSYNGKPVTSIGKYAFYGREGLKSIIIPDSITNIGENAFGECGSGLEKIEVAEGNTICHSAGNCLIETKSKTLIRGCTNSVIPTDGSVTVIGAYAFSYCHNMTNITIPDTVTDIGEWAFEFCWGMTSVTIPDSITSIGYHAFHGCGGLTSIAVASGNPVYSSKGNCLIEKKSKELILGCENSVIPNDVTRIGDCAFYRCYGLTSITIPDSVTDIGQCAFGDCRYLTSITIPDSVKAIPDKAFEDCVRLTSVTIGSGVYRMIGSDAFKSCDELTDIYFNGTKAKWNDIPKYNSWDKETGNYTVHCTDGDIPKN